jgi:hypothetical protein
MRCASHAGPNVEALWDATAGVPASSWRRIPPAQLHQARWVSHDHGCHTIMGSLLLQTCLYVHALGSFVRVAAWPSPFPKGAKRSTQRGGHDHQARTRRKRDECHLTPGTLKPRAQTNQRFNVRHLQVQVPLLVIANNDDTRSGARRPPRGQHCVRRRVRRCRRRATDLRVQ